MIKLNAGFSRKVGEPNYGSRGASVNVELELESNLIGDPAALMNRIRGLFEIARQSVDTELAQGAASPDTAADARQGSASNGCSPGGCNGNHSNNLRHATASQLRAIRAICNRCGLDAASVAQQQFGVNDPGELTLAEASTLIDDLKSQQTTNRNGGRR